MKAHAGRLVLRLSQGSACHAAMGKLLRGNCGGLLCSWSYRDAVWRARHNGASQSYQQRREVWGASQLSQGHSRGSGNLCFGLDVRKRRFPLSRE